MEYMIRCPSHSRITRGSPKIRSKLGVMDSKSMSVSLTSKTNTDGFAGRGQRSADALEWRDDMCGSPQCLISRMVVCQLCSTSGSFVLDQACLQVGVRGRRGQWLPVTYRLGCGDGGVESGAVGH